jgi:hypothetical protein
MTTEQRVLSLLITAHLLAVFVGAVPVQVATLGFVRPATDAYLRATAQTQVWNMFSTPGRASGHVRLGYRLRSADGAPTVEYEQVFPTGDPREWKLVASYFDSFRDKAFTAATESYKKGATEARDAGEQVPTVEMIRGLEPFTRYYARRRIAAGLPPGATLEGVEFWWGTTALPRPPGVEDDGPSTDGAPNWELWAVDDLQ